MTPKFLLMAVTVLYLAGCSLVPQREKPAPVVKAGNAPAAGQQRPSAVSGGDPALVVQEAPPAPGVEIHPYTPPPPGPALPPSLPSGGGQPPAAAPAADVPPPPPASPAVPPPPPAPVSVPPPPAPVPGPAVERPVPASSGGSETQTAYVPPAPAKPGVTAPAETLLKDAERQNQERDYSAAAATLERALRIEPRNAYLWNRLAHVRLNQGQHNLAGNLADRSNALSKEASLKQDNWGVIAAARRQSGDAAGAAEAERKARGGS